MEMIRKSLQPYEQKVSRRVLKRTDMEKLLL